MITEADTQTKKNQLARMAVSAVFFMDGAALGGWVPHIATVKLNLALTSGQLGTALLSSAVGAVVTMPFGGYGIHRFGSRITSLIGGLMLCAILPLLLIAPTLPVFALTLFFVGVFNGQLDVGMNAHSLAVQNRFAKPIVSGIHGWFSVGGFAGGAGAALAAKFGIPPLVHLLIASGLLAAVLLIAFRHLLPASVDAQSEGPKFALPKGALLPIGLLTLFAFIGEGAIWDWTAVYLRTVLKSGAALGALGFGIFSSSMAAGRFIGDHAIHRLGSRAVLQASGAIAALGIWIAVALPTPWTAICGFALAGVGLANTIPILFQAAGSLKDVSAGTGLAAVTTCGYSGFLFGPPFVGFVADARNLSFALGLIACLCMLVALFGKLVLNKSLEPQT